MKRHNNWQEWGRKRAAEHQLQRSMDAIYSDINRLVEQMYERDPVWRFVSRPNPMPFHGGTEMRIPFQYTAVKPDPVDDKWERVELKFASTYSVEEDHKRSKR